LALVALLVLAILLEEPLDQILFLVRLHQLVVAAVVPMVIQPASVAALVAAVRQMLLLQLAVLELQAKDMLVRATLDHQITLVVEAAALDQRQLTPAMETAAMAYRHQ
jgi:hypothetical protein